MSWNGSDHVGAATSPHHAKGGKSHSSASLSQFNSKALLAGLIVVVLGGGAALYFGLLRTPVAPKSVERAASRTIAEVQPAATATNAAPVQEKKISEFEKYNRLRTQAEIMAWKKPANWDQLSPAEKTRIQPVGTIIDYSKRAGKRRFTENSDILIERLLMVRPGGMLLGTGRYDKRFVENFLKSLDTPIEITKDDSEEDVAMKNEVIACRKDLKEAYDRGEDIAEIMRQTEKEIREMSAYSINLQRQFLEYKAEGTHSKAELQECADAINLMMTEKGLDPIKFPGLHLSREKLNSQTKKETK